MDRQAGPGLVPVANETQNSLTRWTKGGKQLRYDLRIIQQPERARACGAGAKASADRRPVDPPPILQLQIFEIMPNGEAHDITFTMHANYFLFAMLERARTIAQPRNGQENGRNIDVLTGTNVTGMQPFDRPVPAIYFIFPDLSVRHEGRYRLLFSLYEDVRRPEDEDRNEMSTMAEQHLVTHRLDVRSAPFDVYSAKRFPGLTESTTLSRTFAEQGSRIRIRRDVRMRRRDKSGKEWADEYDDDNGAQMSRLSHTPDPYTAHLQRQPIEPMQQRPHSSSSQQMMQPRRPSLGDMSGQYHPGQATQANNFAFPGAFPQTAAQPYTQASVLHPPPQMPSTSYQTTPSMVPQQNSYGYGYAAPPQNAQTMSQLSYQSFDNNFQPQRSSADFSAMSTDSRRASMQPLMPQPQQMLTPAAHAQGSMSAYSRADQATHQHQGSMESGRLHGPPEPVQPPTRVTTPTPPSLITKATFGTTTLPPLSTSFPPKLEAASPQSAMQTNSTFTGSLPTPTDSHKRSYGSSFPTSWQNSASKQGARPADMATQSMFLAADTDDGDVTDLTEPTYMGTYRRAGGHTVQRQMP